VPTDFSQFDALVERFQAAGKNAPLEFKRSLQTSKRAAKTEFTRAIRGVYNAKLRSVQRDLRVTEPDLGRLSYSVIGEPSGISVASFGARQNKEGLSVQIRKDGARELIKSGFFPSSGEKSGVPFIREGRARLPIAVVRGPSVAEMLDSEVVRTPAIKATKQRLSDDITKRIARSVRRG
jgi:hypothetical protein